MSSSEEKNKIERVENWELGSDILSAKDSPKFWEQGYKKTFRLPLINNSGMLELKMQSKNQDQEYSFFL